jgi:3-oxoacyl-[acyl-carrier protein] reductase
MLDLNGKVAVVTGASRGIGRAIATMLASRGAVVVAAARGENAGDTVAAITAAGGRAERASVDVVDAASVDAMIAGALAAHGRIDILVNNAGITRDQLMLRMKRDDWDDVIATNLTGAFTCVQAVIKLMVKQRGGRIISVSSVVGQAGNAGQVNYAASKAGLIGFSKALARELVLSEKTLRKPILIMMT